MVGVMSLSESYIFDSSFSTKTLQNLPPEGATTTSAIRGEFGSLAGFPHKLIYAASGSV